MQSFVAAGAVLAAAVVSSVAAAPAPGPEAAPAGVVQWDVRQHRALGRLSRRSDVIQETLVNNLTNGGYFVDAKIGTPPQKVTLLLDTGSSDLWVPESGASICEVTKDNDGCYLGSYDPTASSTYALVDVNGFDISYVDGSGSSGDYFSDTLVLGGATLENFTMGLGEKTTVNFGIAGVGFATEEAHADDMPMGYNNLPVAMKKAGLINSIAYSVWLNDLDASTGNILFGGVDSEKYKGQLTILDMLADSTGEVVDFRVPLTSITATSTSGSDTLKSADFPIGCILDSGTSLAFLPQGLAEQVWAEAGAVYESDVEQAVIPCSRATGGGTFTFGFGGDNGASITVGMDELVLTVGLSEAGAYFTSGPYKGQDACTFGIQNQSEPTGGDYFVLLGDTFMRSAYIVYDLENFQIGMAQTDFNATDTKIQAFASESATIPDGTPAPSQTALQQQPTSVAPLTSFSASAGFTNTATAIAKATTTSSSGSTAASKPKASSAAGAMTVPTGLLHAGVLSAMMFVAGCMLLL